MSEEATIINNSEEAIESKDRNDSENIEQFLTFTINDEEYGIQIMKIREIKGWTPTTRLPNSPDFMKGVINLRGAVVPIFDLRCCFKMGDTEPNEKNVVVILSAKDRLVGLLVDAVSDILSVNNDDIRPAPQVENKIDAQFISGLISREEKMVVLLDVDHLLNSSTLAQVEELAKEASESLVE